jgi:DNA-binding transcriptional MerR regulator
MKISELSRRSGVSLRSLRYYEEKRLLHPRRLPNGYRDYEMGAVAQVQAIQRYLQLGLNTQQIGAILSCRALIAHPGESTTSGISSAQGLRGLRRMYQQKANMIAEEIAYLQATQQRLEEALQWIEEELNGQQEPQLR